MRLRLSIFYVLAACALSAQTLDPSTQLLLDHVKADKDLFGAGVPGGFSLEEQVQKTNSGFQMVITEEGWVHPEESNPKLAGTTQAADAFLLRALRESDLVVTGKVVHQLSILNSYKSLIVTDSLFQVDGTLHAKLGFDVQPGDQLVVARLGGRVHIQGHPVRIDTNDFLPFAEGADYVLFLQQSKITDSYLVQDDGALFVNGDSIRSLYTTRKHPVAAYLSSAQGFLEAVRNSVAGRETLLESAK
jgi:hypothetical protein